MDTNLSTVSAQVNWLNQIIGSGYLISPEETGEQPSFLFNLFRFTDFLFLGCVLARATYDFAYGFGTNSLEKVL